MSPQFKICHKFNSTKNDKIINECNEVFQTKSQLFKCYDQE